MKRLLIVLFVFMCIGCDDVRLPQPTAQLVVEGWVEDGGRPVVMLTTSVPVDTEYKDLEKLKEHIVRWGKVTISDGEDEVILSGRVDRNHFPPYIYTKDTYKISPGKKYTVTAHYSGKVAMASVTVPHRKPLESIRVEKVQEKGDAYRIVAGIRNDSEEAGRYKFFVRREGKDSTYMSSFLGYIDDEAFSSEVEEVAVYNGMSIMSEGFEQYFAQDDVVYVKYCILDDVTWQYWSDYEELTSLARNPFFPVSSKIRSNVSGGLGYFSGYGATYYKVSIADSIALGKVR